MKQVELRQFDSLTGAQAFLDAHRDLFGGINASSSRRRLDAIVTQVQDRITVQLAGTRTALGETEARLGLERELLQGHMLPIAEFARAKMPALEEGEFKALAQSMHNVKGARLVQAALGMADVAGAHLPQLVAAHFPADVIPQLIAAADAVQARLDNRSAVYVERAGATAEIEKGLAAGRAIVRMIGAVVKRTARRNPGLLAAWRAAQRVKRKPGGTRDDATAAHDDAAAVSAISPAAPAPATEIRLMAA